MRSLGELVISSISTCRTQPTRAAWCRVLRKSNTRKAGTGSSDRSGPRTPVVLRMCGWGVSTTPTGHWSLRPGSAQPTSSYQNYLAQTSALVGDGGLRTATIAEPALSNSKLRSCRVWHEAGTAPLANWITNSRFSLGQTPRSGNRMRVPAFSPKVGCYPSSLSPPRSARWEGICGLPQAEQPGRYTKPARQR